MAKKVVATISSGTKNFVKVISAVNSKRNSKSISFKEQMLPLEKAEEYIQKIKK
ncbi:MAG: DUF4295 domain-containing protein [Cytophagales bacterium]|jgi:hypothetical protein|nr:DUF4295 domain-containing protein [Cytophagales bacterium]